MSHIIHIKDRNAVATTEFHNDVIRAIRDHLDEGKPLPVFFVDNNTPDFKKSQAGETEND